MFLCKCAEHFLFLLLLLLFILFLRRRYKNNNKRLSKTRGRPQMEDRQSYGPPGSYVWLLDELVETVNIAP